MSDVCWSDMHWFKTALAASPSEDPVIRKALTVKRLMGLAQIKNGGTESWDTLLQEVDTRGGERKKKTHVIIVSAATHNTESNMGCVPV